MRKRQVRVQADRLVRGAEGVMRAVLICQSHCKQGMGHGRVRERLENLPECLLGGLGPAAGQEVCALLQARVGDVGPVAIEDPPESRLKAHVDGPLRARPT
jgi:hypothetical protein